MRGKRLFAATLALCAATAVSPPAQAADDYASCDPMASALTALTGSAGVALGRGGTSREPSIDQTHTDLPNSAKGKAGPGFTASVPVWFHVVTDGATGALTDAQVAAQIRVLNTTFSGGEGGADTGFTFVLAGITRTNDAGWFNGKLGGTTEQSMKTALHRGGPETLNIYSTAGGGYLGWAYLPDVTTKPGQTDLDGVVINWESFKGVSKTYADRYDQGETTTHEVGHWLNLEHTFFGGCNDKGDFVADTPAEKTAASGCPIGRDTCTKPGEDPIHNYMDYSYDSCYTEFTPGQATRMGQMWMAYRA